MFVTFQGFRLSWHLTIEYCQKVFQVLKALQLQYLVSMVDLQAAALQHRMVLFRTLLLEEVRTFRFHFKNIFRQCFIILKRRASNVYLLDVSKIFYFAFIYTFICFSAHFRLDAMTDKKKVVQMMVMPNSGLDIKNRTWLKIPIPMSFLGKIYLSRNS